MSAPESASLSSRDLRLDSLRGLMLVGMALNHITSPLQLLTDHPLGYTSAAEGFVFLSGLVAGLVYTRRRARLGAAAVTQASRARAFTIYACHVALVAGLVLWANLYATFMGQLAGNTSASLWHHPWASVVTGALLVNQPPLLDILPLYAGFMLALPLILRALDRGQHRWVLGVSGACWLLTNLFYPDIPYVGEIVQIGAFYFGAWQLLFVIGAIFGHAWAEKRRLLPEKSSPALLSVAFGLCAYCFLIRHWYLSAPFASFADWVNKNNLAPVRLLNTLALFYLVHAAFVRWPKLFTWPPLALLGRHSLVIFSVHVATAYVLYAFPHYVSSTPLQRWVGSGLMLTVLFAFAWVCDQAKAVAVAPVLSRRTAS